MLNTKSPDTNPSSTLHHQDGDGRPNSKGGDPELKGRFLTLRATSLVMGVKERWNSRTLRFPPFLPKCQ